jgi:hypothetical protein
MGMLAGDRRPSFEGRLDRKLDGLADGIGQEAGSWLRTMRDGGPRSRARSLETVWCHMNNVRPALLDWSQRYDHLREVTRDDIQAVMGGLHGTRRSSFLVSLRSLFAFRKKKGMVFRNPASGIKVGQHPNGIAQPLGQDDVDQAAEAAATPSARLVLVLAAVHAARTGAIRATQLDDVGLGNRRLTLAGRVRPIDEFTHQVLLDWLGYRRTRWPGTANPHLLINQHSAMAPGQSARSTTPRPNSAARARPWNGCASTGNSKKPSPTDPTRCTWQRCSASTPRPPSATRRTPACSSPPGPRNKIPPVLANPRARTSHRA